MATPKTGNPHGRPTLYTPELAEYILNKVRCCNTGLNIMCANDPKLPNPNAIYEWRHNFPDFGEKYILARKQQTHLLIEQVKDIAEETYRYTYLDKDSGAERIDSGMIALQNMRIKANVMLAARINPKDYSEKKQEEQINNSDALARVQALVADFNKTNASDV